MLNYSARKHSPTWDEPGYLAAGLSHWELGRFDLYSVNPPLVRTIAAAPVYLFSGYKIDWDGYRSNPAMRSEVFVGRRFMELNGENANQYFYLARLAVLPFALLGTWLCFAWGRELFGVGAGLLAAAIWVFSPFVLAHGALITPDLPSAVTMLAASLAFWKWLKSPSYSRAGVFAAAIAIAMLTKSVWLVLPVVFFLTGSTYLVIRGRVHQFQASGFDAAHVRKQGVAWQAWGQLVGAMLLAILLTNAFYGFASSGKPLGDFQFVSRAFAGPGDCEDCSAQPGNRFAGSWSGKLPVPLPANYLQGIDIQRRDFERGRFDPAWKSYLLGEWKQGGWWYYYLVGLAAKIPLPIIVLVVAGAIVSATRFGASPSYRVTSTKWAFCVLLLPAMVLLILLSANSGLNRYVRYALPVLPVLFIVAGATASMVNVKRRWHVVGIAIPLVWLVALSLSTSPHWLSYFNPIAGGPANGQRVLCDSNIDWGQDLLLLQEWLNKNPQAKEDLHLAYFGSFDPVAMGVSFSLPRPFLSLRTPGSNELTSANSSRLSPSDRLQPGWYVISKNYVVGHPISLPDGSGKPRFRYYGGSAFSYFSTLVPVDRIGNSMLVYRVPQSPDDSQLVPLKDLRTQLASTSL